MRLRVSAWGHASFEKVAIVKVWISSDLGTALAGARRFFGHAVSGVLPLP